jgi:DNA-binding MarR family transcriptional regulator
MKKTKRLAAGPADELADSLDFLIRDTRLLLTAFIAQRTAGQGIPLRLWFPLRVLYKNEAITQRELGRMLGYGDAHAGVIVGAMQRRGFIDRRRSAVDKRRIDLFLTPAGKDAARRSLRLMRAINAHMVAGLSPAEAAALKSLLSRVRGNLKTS